MKKEDVKQIIKEENKYTEYEWMNKGNQANQNKDFENFYQRWSWVQHEMLSRKKEVEKIMYKLRNENFDVKMDLQEYKLSYWGLIDGKEIDE